MFSRTIHIPFGGDSQRHLIALMAIWFVVALLVWCPWAASASAGNTLRIVNDHTIGDQAGRTIVVKKPFRRIISLYGAHTENLFALGLDTEIIGVSPHEKYPPAATAKPVYSYHDDPEKFLAARPDLVLVRPMIDRGYPKLIRRLNTSGIRVVSMQPATVEEMQRYWHMLGILTGRRAEATRMVTRFQSGLAGFESLRHRIGARKRVYFEAIHNKMKTFAPHAMAIFALETAGGINVAVDARQVRTTNIAFYGKERILSRAAEIDVYLAQKGAMNQPSVEMIKSEPGFAVIKAVKQDQVFIIDEMIISRPTLRLLEGIFRIGHILYPRVFDAEAAQTVGVSGGFLP